MTLLLPPVLSVLRQILQQVLGTAYASRPLLNCLQAASMLANGVSSALPHLRTINPQVATMLAAAAAKGGPRPHLPRQGCPRALLDAAEASTMGISSFAFQVQCHPTSETA